MWLIHVKPLKPQYPHTTVEPRYNKPLYNEVLSITYDFLYLINSKTYGKVPRYTEQILQALWHVVIYLSFRCNSLACFPHIS